MYSTTVGAEQSSVMLNHLNLYIVNITNVMNVWSKLCRSS